MTLLTGVKPVLEVVQCASRVCDGLRSIGTGIFASHLLPRSAARTIGSGPAVARTLRLPLPECGKHHGVPVRAKNWLPPYQTGWQLPCI